MEWIAISNNIWSKVKDSPTLVTATEVPFMPVLETAVKDPYDALTLPVSIAFMRKRRSAASNDMWGCKYQLVFLFIVSYFQWTGAFVGFFFKKKGEQGHREIRYFSYSLMYKD